MVTFMDSRSAATPGDFDACTADILSADDDGNQLQETWACIVALVSLDDVAAIPMPSSARGVSSRGISSSGVLLRGGSSSGVSSTTHGVEHYARFQGEQSYRQAIAWAVKLFEKHVVTMAPGVWLAICLYSNMLAALCSGSCWWCDASRARQSDLQTWRSPCRQLFNSSLVSFLVVFKLCQADFDQLAMHRNCVVPSAN